MNKGEYRCKGGGVASHLATRPSCLCPLPHTLTLQLHDFQYRRTGRQRGCAWARWGSCWRRPVPPSQSACHSCHSPRWGVVIQVLVRLAGPWEQVQVQREQGAWA